MSHIRSYLGRQEPKAERMCLMPFPPKKKARWGETVHPNSLQSLATPEQRKAITDAQAKDARYRSSMNGWANNGFTSGYPVDAGRANRGDGDLT
jgi:hypothetical protein